MADGELLGRSVLELVTDGTQLDSGLSDAEQRAEASGERAGKGFSTGMAIAVGAGMLAVGSAIEGFNRGQQDLSVMTRQVAAGLGESEEAVRSWATEMTDAGFPLRDAIELMDLAERRGLDTKDAIQGYARFWDMVADASGEAAVELANAGIGLQGIGIAAGQEAEALDAIGFIMGNTTASVAEFLTFIERTGPELRVLGADVEDAAAIMGVLENELGLSGRVARTEFRQAINDSDGSLQGLLETLGVSTSQFEAYREQVRGAGADVENDAAIFNEARTPLQQLTASFEDFMFENAAAVEGLGSLAMILMAGGPLVTGIKVLTNLIKPPGLTTAMAGLLGPLGLVIVALTTLTTLGSEVVRNLDPVGVSFNELASQAGRSRVQIEGEINALAREMGMSLEEAKQAVLDYAETTGAGFDAAVEAVRNGTQESLDAAEEAGNAWADHSQMLSDLLYGAGPEIDAAAGDMADGIPDAMQDAKDKASEVARSTPGALGNSLRAGLEEYQDDLDELVEMAENSVSDLRERQEIEGILASESLTEALNSDSTRTRLMAQELVNDLVSDYELLAPGALEAGEMVNPELRAGIYSNLGLAREAGEAVVDAAGNPLITLNAYPWGAAIPGSVAAGMWDNMYLISNAANEMASRVSMAARIESEPPDHNSPLYGITKWGGNIVKTIANGIFGALSIGEQASLALAGALVPGLGVPSLTPAGAAVGPSMAGGGMTQYILQVDGRAIVVGDREDVLDGWDRLERSRR